MTVAESVHRFIFQMICLPFELIHRVRIIAKLHVLNIQLKINKMLNVFVISGVIFYKFTPVNGKLVAV